MGFAGQIFAARVAVGLAVPSPKAVQAQGGILAKAVEGIYGKMNADARAQMKKRVQDTKKSSQEASKAVIQQQDLLNKELTSKLEGGLMRAKDANIRFAKSLSQGSKTAFAEFKKYDPEMAGKLLKGLSKITSAQGKARQMALNWAQMTAAEQSRTMARFEQRADATKKEAKRLRDKQAADVEAARVRHKIALKEAGTDKDAIKRANATFTDYQSRKEREIATADKTHQRAVDELDDMRNIRKEVSAGVGPAIERLNELRKKEKLTAEEAAEAEKLMSQELKGVEQASTQVAQAMHNAAFAVKDSFSNAVRESISVLTGFYYKLNQNTQELIEFERELLNANSVWNESRDTLFEAGEVITQFGQKFGIEMQNGATGLYQLASAGLTAAEALQVLPETLKLSMAVQGDHNTIAKLTTQTLKGFDMEMGQAAEVTDKFAHAIQKSLIEYEDLGSAVKFALPFFTSTGQSIDQLLGALQILTNRALEAGIAGRGLRQALAEFAEGAEDNSTAFRKMGIDILDANGEMKQLSDIAAEFSQVVGTDVITNTELLTSLIQDLNVRGATAFVHLVQASDEFTEAVENTANAGGELDEMVRIQNESISAQIQILHNNVSAIFFMRDATYEGTEFMNAFHEAIVNAVESLSDLLVIEEEGAYKLTEFGQAIQDIAVEGIEELVILVKEAVVVIKDLTEEGALNMNLLKLYTIPLKVVLGILNAIGPTGIKIIAYYRVLNMLLPINTLFQQYNAIAIANATLVSQHKMLVDAGLVTTTNAVTISVWGSMTAWVSETFWKAASTLGTWLWNAAWLIAAVAMIAVMVIFAPLILLYIWYTGTVVGATAATWLFWAAISLGILPAIALLIWGLYELSQNTEAIGASTESATTSISDGWLKVVNFYEDSVYPTIHRLGLEFMAIGAIFAFTLKWIYDAAYEAFGNGTVIDVIVGGFQALWGFLFDPSSGWLRWLTLTWWSNAMADVLQGATDLGQSISDGVKAGVAWMLDLENGPFRFFTLTWWTNAFTTVTGAFASFSLRDALTASFDVLPEWIKDPLTYFAAKLADLLSVFTDFKLPEFDLPTVDLRALFGFDAFATAWNAFANMMSNVAMTISIPGFGISLPSWAGGHGFSWAGYSQTLGFQSIQ